MKEEYNIDMMACLNLPLTMINEGPFMKEDL